MTDIFATIADFIPSALIAIGGIVIGLLVLLTIENK